MGLFWQLYVLVNMTITSSGEVTQLLVKHPLIYWDLKKAKNLFFSPSVPNWYDSIEGIAAINSQQSTPEPPPPSPIFHAFFGEACDIDHPLTFKGDTHQHNLAGDEQSLSFLPLLTLNVIYAPDPFTHFVHCTIGPLRHLSFTLCPGTWLQ